MSNQLLPIGWADSEPPLENTTSPINVLQRRLHFLNVTEKRLKETVKKGQDAQIELDKVVTSAAATDAAIKELRGLATIECPACHEELPKVARFCSDCGYELGK